MISSIMLSIETYLCTSCFIPSSRKYICTLDEYKKSKISIKCGKSAGEDGIMTEV